MTKPTILHVEDLEVVRCMFEAQSKGKIYTNDYSIVGCETLALARVEIAKRMPTAIVLDMQLPDGSGAELIDVLDPSCLVIFVTAEPSSAPKGHHVVAKGPRWIRDVLEVMRKAGVI
jgi:DNA-binding response OmpR family regulator